MILLIIVPKYTALFMLELFIIAGSFEFCLINGERFYIFRQKSGIKSNLTLNDGCGSK